MDIPKDWIQGELLNVKNFGSYFEVKPFYDRDPPLEPLIFESALDTQNFVSLWYARTFQ